MDTCNCKSKATISTIGGVEKLHSSTCSKETEWKWPKEEEPKPACDHIVGLRNIYHITNGLQPGFIEVYESDLSKDHVNFYHFKRCPECGEKLNLKKDE